MTSIKAKLVKFSNMKINCVDPDSEWFVPREDHTSCQTWDQRIWVYGGRRNIEDKTHVMDDLMYFDSKTNRWYTGNTNGKFTPGARYGHVMFCYYNYLIIFGGLTNTGRLLGDLWVYDVTKEVWKMVIDNSNTVDLQAQGIEGIIPRERGYASAVMLPIMGAGYMLGGKNRDGFACDLWALKVDRVIQHIEDPKTVKLDNFWVKKQFEDEGTKQLCRFGHSTVEINNRKILIYGGIDPQGNTLAAPLLYNVFTQELHVLSEYGNSRPPARNKPAMVSPGNSFAIMYGGVDPKMRGYLTDLWHFKVTDEKIIYEKVDHEFKGTSYMVSWRSGFTMEYLRDINDPQLIGGTYGNNQQCQAIISMPEIECSDKKQYDTSTCSPCPRGSIYNEEIKD